MRILHYSLGLPPYRSGGLTKYSCDLMEEQVKQGEEVFLLFPGVISLMKKKSNIKYYKKHNEVKAYEIINPLPVPLMNGIKDVECFMQTTDYSIYKKFLEAIKVDVINIHTLMGLHKEFFIAAKELKIPIIYTTHDYFGLCTKVNFLDNNFNVCSERNYEKCAVCNRNGDSLKKIFILQSKEYRFLKNIGVIDKLKHVSSKVRFKGRDIKDNKKNVYEVNTEYKDKYCKLLSYYEDIFKTVDKFIFNSSVAKDIYSQYIECKGEVYPITHKDIKDNRKIKDYSQDKLRLTYLGPDKEYKGFNLLLDVMKILDKDGFKNITLDVFGKTHSVGKIYNNIMINGAYSYKGLGEIFEKTDILLVPSIWYETFGFITLEALSYGVPVLLTDRVGSKDIVSGNNWGTVVDTDINMIVNEIKRIYKNRDILKEYNMNVMESKFKYLLENHYKCLKNIYKKGL